MTTQYAHISPKYPRAFIKIDYILGDKRSLNTFEMIQDIQSIYYDDSGIRFEINNMKPGKSPNI